MNPKDRTEIREMLHDILSGWQATNTAQADITNQGLTDIKNHLSKLNGKVAEHEKMINIHLPHNILNCPQTSKITEIRDNMITGQAIRRTITASIAATGTVFSVLFILYKVFIEKQIS